MKSTRFNLFRSVIFGLFSFVFIQGSYAQTFTVTEESDGTDNWFDCSPGIPSWWSDVDGDPLSGSFIEGLGRLNSGTADRIEFNIAGTGPFVINLASANGNPDLCASNVVIDGTTQQDVSGNPNITIIGRDWATIRVKGNNDTIKGLNIIGLVQVYEGGSNNVITENYFGTNNTGTAASSFTVASGNDAVNGVTINGSNDNTISNNVIANSKQDAIKIEATSLRNIIDNNIIGFDKTGTIAISNGVLLGKNAFPSSWGININGNSNFTEIRNNLVGNSINGSGIRSQNSSSHTIEENIIGLDITGLVKHGNIGQGVLLEGGNGSTIHKNLISGNGNSSIGTDDVSSITGHGIELRNSNSNTVTGNWVGLDSTGNAIIGNEMNGIYVQNGSSNTIGGADLEDRNIVGGNGFGHVATEPDYSRHGIQIDGNFFTGNPAANGNQVINNWVGIGTDGTTNLGNSEDGISVYRNSFSTLVEDNIVVYNNEGIFIQTHSDNNEVYGNYVGLLPDGVTAVGNTNDGIKIHSGEGNIIGGTTSGQENYIVGHGQHGIHLTIGGSQGTFDEEAADNNMIQNNIVGHDGSNTAWANAGNGIQIADGSSSNIVGGTGTNESNLIANNGGNGIVVNGITTIQNTFIANEIYCNGDRGIELDNTGNENFASSGSGSSATLYVDNASTAPNFFGIAPLNTATIHVYDLGECNTCGEDENHAAQGKTYLGTATFSSTTGEWEFDASAFPSVTNITVTATDDEGNTSEFAQCVTVCQPPSEALLTPAGPIEFCSGESQELTASLLTDYLYTFYDASGVIQSQSSTNTITVQTSGEYYAVIADGFDPTNTNCQATTNTVEITVNDAATITSVSGASPVCDGDVEIYTISPENTNSTYSWSLPTDANIVGDATGASVSIDFSGASSGDVSVTETTENGCTNTTPVTTSIVVNALPATSIISGDDEVCDGDVEIYSVTETVGSTYDWEIPTGATVTLDESNQITVDFTGASSGDISVTETNSNGCTASSATTLPIAVNSLPVTPEIGGEIEPACSATGIVYGIVTVNPGSTYSWSLPNGASIDGADDGSSITVDFGTSNGSISVIETNSNGCISASGSLAISLQGCGLSPDFTGVPTTVCVGSTVTFTDNSTGTTSTTTYAWDFGAGATPATANTAGPHTVTYSTLGNATVSLTLTDGAVVMEEKADYITVVDTPSTSAITGVSPVCENDQGVVYSVTETTGSSYQWSVPDAEIDFGNGSSSISVNWENTSSTVSVTETNAAGCVASTAVEMPVTVNLLTGDAGAITAPTVDICDSTSGNTYEFSIDAVDNATTYNWTVPDDAIIVTDNGTSIIVDFQSEIGDNISISVEPEGLCGTGESMSTSVTVLETKTPTLSLSTSANGVCANEPITISAFPSNGGDAPTIIWYYNNEVLQDSTGFSITSNNFEDGDIISAEFTSNQECLTTETASADNDITLSLIAFPNAEAGLDITLDNSEATFIGNQMYKDSTTSTGVTYQWTSSIDDDEINDDSKNPISLLIPIEVTPTEEKTTYYLTVTNPAGCSDIDSMVVDILFTIWIPSGMSPNGDLVNDGLEIYDIDKYPNNTIEIYNRWGSLVWSKDNYSNDEPWLGTNQDGKDLPMATYYYIVKLNDDDNTEFAGPITIIK